jgi:hypothetical protein
VPPRTITLAQKTEAQLLVKKQPVIIKNSPIKLLVPGKPILAIVNNINKLEYNGIV